MLTVLPVVRFGLRPTFVMWQREAPPLERDGASDSAVTGAIGAWIIPARTRASPEARSAMARCRS
jgi:hypothetical protein